MSIPRPTRLKVWVLPDAGTPHVSLRCELQGGRTGIARCGCVNTGGVVQKLCMLPTLRGEPLSQAGVYTNRLGLRLRTS